MDDALRVGGGNGVGNLAGVAQRPLERQPAGGDGAIERHAVDVLHDDEGEIVLLLDGVDGDAVGMVEGRRRAGFVQEPLRRFLIGAGGEDLDRHGAVEHRIAGAIHDPHPAFTEARVDRVMEKRGANHGRLCGPVVRL